MTEIYKYMDESQKRAELKNPDTKSGHLEFHLCESLKNKFNLQVTGSGAVRVPEWGWGWGWVTDWNRAQGDLQG